MLERGDTATLWGIERDEGAGLYGKLVVPVITIWQTVNRKKHAGRLAHETPVKILKSKRARHDGRIYYRVKGEDNAGKAVTGYVPHTFIKEHL